jgi:actinin alpha
MTPWLENRTTDNTLPVTRKKLGEFSDYKRVKKPPRLEQKAKLETDFNTLQTKLSASYSPPYSTVDGKLVSVCCFFFKRIRFKSCFFFEGYC